MSKANSDNPWTKLPSGGQYVLEQDRGDIEALLGRAASDCEKVFAVSLGESAISFRQIRGDGNGCPV